MQQTVNISPVKPFPINSKKKTQHILTPLGNEIFMQITCTTKIVYQIKLDINSNEKNKIVAKVRTNWIIY